MTRSEVPQEFKTVEGITNPQLSFINNLLNERDLRRGGKIAAASPEEYAAAVDNLRQKVSNLSKRDASRWIEKLLSYPMLPAERQVRRGGEARIVPSADELPDGRYAVENNDGELRFYRLWRGTRNPNFVKLYISHGPDDSEIPFRSALSIMDKIMEAGPLSAARRYGAEIGACSKCGRRLTNRISRLLKIGPVCGGRYFSEDDYQWKGLVDAARTRLAESGLDPAGNVEDNDDFDYSQDVS
jgi:hypothetical protein